MDTLSEDMSMVAAPLTDVVDDLLRLSREPSFVHFSDTARLLRHAAVEIQRLRVMMGPAAGAGVPISNRARYSAERLGRAAI